MELVAFMEADVRQHGFRWEGGEARQMPEQKRVGDKERKLKGRSVRRGNNFLLD